MREAQAVAGSAHPDRPRRCARRPAGRYPRGAHQGHRAHRRLGLEFDPPAARHAAGRLSGVSLPWGATIPLRPFFGILAVAPRPNYGPCSSVEPREFGGNMDNKEFLVDTSLYLPVFVPGANFSAGDGHAVQGDGEVCLTALETCLTGTFELGLPKNKKLDMPRAVTTTHYIAMGLDPDLDDAARQALRD